MSDTWKCPTCGEKYRADVPICRNCRTPSMIRPGGLTGVRRPLSRRTKSDQEIPAVTPAPPAPPPEPPPPGPAPPPPPAQGVEVRFPVILKDVRYSLPIVTGEIWTQGFLVAVEEGIYLISLEDDLDAQEVARRSIRQEGHLARHSVYFTRDAVLRIVRGQHLEARGGKAAIRLSDDGWEELDVIREALGIPE